MRNLVTNCNFFCVRRINGIYNLANNNIAKCDENFVKNRCKYVKSSKKQRKTAKNIKIS